MGTGAGEYFLPRNLTNCEPRGLGDVFSHPVPAPDPEPIDAAESRAWAWAPWTLTLFQELVSGLTWVDSEGPPSSSGAVSESC